MKLSRFGERKLQRPWLFDSIDSGSSSGKLTCFTKNVLWHVKFGFNVWALLKEQNVVFTFSERCSQVKVQLCICKRKRRLRDGMVVVSRDAGFGPLLRGGYLVGYKIRDKVDGSKDGSSGMVEKVKGISKRVENGNCEVVSNIGKYVDQIGMKELDKKSSHENFQHGCGSLVVELNEDVLQGKVKAGCHSFTRDGSKRHFRKLVKVSEG
ncbi:unnamed protein product [Lactuca saligna]|uniref:Uncharacterized protein n=1 Tax=Lactuca saligna TaxID=75948 RepID=A0AA35ZG02_LACSI|nr:unnamed protein product [Lactuca saligna]